VIIGIDPKSNGVAMCAMHADGTFHAVTALTIPIKNKSRAQIVGGLYDFVLKHISATDRIYIEEPVVAGARNLQSTIKVAAGYGAILAAIGTKQATAVTVPVSVWKLATVGKGNVSKVEVSQWLHSMHDLHYTACGGDQDCIDASCIAIYGVQHSRMAERIDRGHVLHQAASQKHPRHRRGGD
jgi:Holliday junction resolvasome RuvABC endonuclease subunit